MSEEDRERDQPLPELGAGADTARFSLLLPVYAGDDAQHLRMAFHSTVHEQTLRPSEVVLVQDGQVGGDLETEIRALVAESPIEVHLVRLPENQGLTAALNAGLAACSHDVVARMDADDLSMPDRFAKQWRVLSEGYDLVGTGMAEFRDDPEVIHSVRTPPVGETRIRDHARTHNPFNHPTMMYRVRAIEAIGGYEPFGKMEDYWLGIRLIDSGARTANIAEPLVKYRANAGAYGRRGGLSEARTEWRLQREMLSMGFITRGEYLRNVIMKGVYRLLPAWLKRVLFGRFVSGGLPGDRR